MNDLTAAYEKLYGKKPVGRWANDAEWLEKKIAEKSSSTDPVEEEELEIVVEVKEEPKECKCSSVSVMEGSQVIREYSSDRHGKDFKKLAQSFADQYARYRIVQNG
jgi:hypothetical protein